MRTYVLVACVLLAAAVCTANEEAQKFHKEYAECAEGLSSAEEDLVKIGDCMLEKKSLLDGDGTVNQDKLAVYLGQIITDNGRLEQAKKIVSDCREKTSPNSGNIDEMRKMLIVCSYPVTKLVDEN